MSEKEAAKHVSAVFVFLYRQPLSTFHLGVHCGAHHTHTRSFKDLLTHHWQVYAPDTNKRPIEHKAKKPRAKRKRKQLRGKTL
jgi:hypothetical protein